MLVHVNPGDPNFDFIANAVDFRGPLSNQGHMQFMEMVIVIMQITQADQAFNGIIQLDEYAEARNTADNALEFLADLVQHEFAFF